MHVGSCASPFATSSEYGHAPTRYHTTIPKSSTLHRPPKDAAPGGPLDVLQLGACAEVLSIVRFKIKMLEIARIALNVDAVFTEVKLADVTIVTIAGSFEAIGRGVVQIDFVVHRCNAKTGAIGIELHVLNPVSRITIYKLIMINYNHHHAPPFKQWLERHSIENKERAVFALPLAVP